MKIDAEAQYFRPIPNDREPYLKNRFVVCLPEDCGVDSYLAHEVSSMKFDFQKGTWNDMTFSFIEIIQEEHVFNRLMGYFTSKNAPISIMLLDGPLEKAYNVVIDEYEVVSMARPDLSYGEDGLYLTKLTIRPVAITFGNEGNRKTYRNRE